MLSEENKEKLKNLGILFGMFILVSALLITLVFVSRGFVTKGLRNNIQNALNENYPKTYAVGQRLTIKTGITLSAAAFECKKNGSSEKPVAVIIRIPAVTGPVPAVFLCTENSTEFVCYAINNGNVDKIIAPEFSSAIIEYWKKQIPQILLKGGVVNE